MLSCACWLRQSRHWNDQFITGFRSKQSKPTLSLEGTQIEHVLNIATSSKNRLISTLSHEQPSQDILLIQTEGVH